MDTITPEQVAATRTIESINNGASSSDGMLKAGIASLMNAKVILILVLLVVLVYWFWFRQPFTTHPVVLDPQSTWVMKN